jgi:hypothetical protein
MATLGALDLRTAEQRQGVTNTQRNIQAILGIIDTVGKAEEVRRERQTLDRIARAVSSGATTIEAISAAAGQGPEFSGGIPGILQRIGGAFQPSPGGVKQGIQQSIIGEALKRALTPQGRVPPGLTPSGATVSPEGAVTTRFAQPTPATPAFEQTGSEKARNRDSGFLTKKDSKGNLIASPAQRNSARRRLRANPSLQDIVPGQTDYSDNLKGKPKVKKGIFDKAFGEEAYKQALQDAKDQGLAAGATESSIEADFNSWWDRQVAKEKGDTFVEFVPRSEFQDITAEEEVGNLSDEELKRIAEGG